MKQLLLLFSLALGLQAQFIDTTADLPTNVAGVGAAIGPTRADGAGWGAYGRLLSRATGTYSLTGISVVPALMPAANGHRQVVLTSTVFTGVEQVVAKYGRVAAVMDAGVGAAMPVSGGGSFSFSGNYAGALFIRTSAQPKPGAGSVVLGARFTQTPFGFVPTVFVGHAWGW
jgi:hypothetical protein